MVHQSLQSLGLQHRNILFFLFACLGPRAVQTLRCVIQLAALHENIVEQTLAGLIKLKRSCSR
jgi:hypothetical protein